MTDVQFYVNGELTESITEDSSIDVLVNETLKTNKKHKPRRFDRSNGTIWVMFDNKRVVFNPITN